VSVLASIRERWLRLLRSRDPVVTDEDITFAYRTILGREPDPAGLRAYREAATAGLSLRALLQALADSDEHRANARAQVVPELIPAAVIRADDDPADARTEERAGPALIKPKDIIDRTSAQTLNDAADEYYRRVPDPTPLISKPFAYWHEAPQMLHDLGLVFEGLHLGKAMRVLDFGAGTCWVSRILLQLNCEPIACDVSRTALSIGRRLFESYPPIGTPIYRPQFVVFDGRSLPLAADSFDRILSFDAFHHVARPDDVIREFARILKPGGIVGFSEPGRNHSASAQSQYEMRHHAVLENDIDLERLLPVSLDAGFTSVTVRALTSFEFDGVGHAAVLRDNADAVLRRSVWQNIRHEMINRTIFFLHKGPLQLDSRQHTGLAHQMVITPDRLRLKAQISGTFHCEIVNTGSATWLHEGPEIFGLVRVGSHLATAEGQLISLDFSRHPLPRVVKPGETVALSVSVALPSPGRYRLTFDLVSEGVTWFENTGSQPVVVTVEVE
jgi:SAM-dependent methyltransferase